MSDNQLDPEQQQAYREDLEAQAEMLGVEFRPNISDEKLAQRVKAAKEGSQVQGDTDDEETPKVTGKKAVNLVPQDKLVLDRRVLQNERRKEARKLIRVQISCLDPAKKDWQGEILEVSNSLVNERHHVPFGVPWHLPMALIKMIQSKQYQRFYTRKDKFGNETRYGRNEPAYNVSFLQPLTEKELASLAKKQMARGEQD